MSSDIEVGPDHAYLVTVVCRATQTTRVSGANTLPGGASIEIEDDKFLLRIPVRAVNAAMALAFAREQTEDLCRVLASAYSPFRIDLTDERDHITRTDAVRVDVGPIPAADVAEGYYSPEGMAVRDPTGEARRAGAVFRVRASGYATRPIDESVHRFASRDAWTPRIRAALSLYWAGQCVPDQQVKFVLSIAALELLAERPGDTVLSIHLDRSAKQSLLADLRDVLTSHLHDEDPVQRVLNQIASTRAVGQAEVMLDYLNAQIPTDSESFGGRATLKEMKIWLRQRGKYLHAGPHDESGEANRARLISLVGIALRRELDLAPARIE